MRNAISKVTKGKFRLKGLSGGKMIMVKKKNGKVHNIYL
jgi:hypothetical protein